MPEICADEAVLKPLVHAMLESAAFLATAAASSPLRNEAEMLLIQHEEDVAKLRKALGL